MLAPTTTPTSTPAPTPTPRSYAGIPRRIRRQPWHQGWHLRQRRRPLRGLMDTVLPLRGKQMTAERYNCGKLLHGQREVPGGLQWHSLTVPSMDAKGECQVMHTLRPTPPLSPFSSSRSRSQSSSPTSPSLQMRAALVSQLIGRVSVTHLSPRTYIWLKRGKTEKACAAIFLFLW